MNLYKAFKATEIYGFCVSQLRQLRPQHGLIEEAEAKLVDLGLTPNQARVYVALLRLGGGKASEAARQAGVERAEAYRALSKLSELGLVKALLTRPLRFIPTPPEEGVGRLLEAMSDRLRRMKQAAAEAVELLSKAQRRPSQEAATLELIVGRRRAFRRALEMIDQARSRAYCVTSSLGLVRAARGGVLEAFEDAVSRGVEVKMVSEIVEDNRREAELFSKVVKLRHADQLNAFLLIVDGEALVGVTIREDLALDTEDHIELWTNSDFFVSQMHQFFERVWGEAVDAHLRLQEVVQGL